MSILLKNALILSMIDDEEYYFGNVEIEGKIIKQIIKGEIGDTSKYSKVIDCKRNLLMPTFKNAHTHSAMNFLRGIAKANDLDTWLFKQVVPYERLLRDVDVYHLTKLAIFEYLESGIGTIFDMYYYPDSIAKAVNDMKYKAVILGSIGGKRQSKVETKKRFIKYNSDLRSSVSFCLGMHAEYTANTKDIKDLVSLSNELKAPIYTHISESKNEVATCIDKHKCSPVEYLESLGMFEYGGGGFHGVYLTDNDIKIFNNRGLSIVTCPSSNVRLGNGIAPVRKFIDSGLNVALGTDGPASNGSLDFFYEMRLLDAFASLNKETRLTSFEILKIATINGAKALGLNNAMYLKENQDADIIMIDLSKANMHPINDLIYQLVHSADKSNVMMTMIDGNILYYKNKFYTDDKLKFLTLIANAISTSIKLEMELNSYLKKNKS